MTDRAALPFDAELAAYEAQAGALLEALESEEQAARWRFKWEHPRFKGKPVTDVHPAELTLDDARMVIAQEYSFDSWEDLAAFVKLVRVDEKVARFERAVENVISGNTGELASMLRADPELVRARSMRRHHATLLHYVGANGVERQQTPPNALEITRLLLEAGAEVDSLADLYDSKCTTMSMLVSSVHPAEAGLQLQLAELLLDYGAACEGPGTNWQSAVLTALAFGYTETARGLARRCPPSSLPAAAGLGLTEEAARLLPASDAQNRHIALALAAQHGHTAVVKLLLDAGEDPSRHNPDGYHSHSTPLHQAVWAEHDEVVRLLVEWGASLEIKDKIYEGTPLDWAVYGQRDAIAAYLRERMQSS